MKPKSTRLAKPDTSDFGQVSVDTWRISGKIMTLDEFIDDQSRQINSTDLRELERFSNRLSDKLKETNGDEYPGLPEAVNLIIEILKSPATQQVKDPLPRWLAEIGFAAGYLLRRYDLIPDHLPGIGLADDALILQRVIERNQSDLKEQFGQEGPIGTGHTHRR
jgi:Protein of unknown function (DUF1232)